jgi:hypothetical protein
MTDDPRSQDGRWTVDGRFRTVYRAGDDAAVQRGPRQPAGTTAARPAGRTTGEPAPGEPAPGKAPKPAVKAAHKRARGVTAGRVAAAGVGLAAMIGLAAQMQVAGNAAAAAAGAAPTPAKPAGPAPTAALQRWEQGVHQGPATDPQRYAAADARKPIVLTPHTIVNTVGGGSSGGSSGYAASAPSYSAPSYSAPVASSGGSAPH